MVHRIGVIGGDGIGPEIMPQTRRVVEWFAANRGLALELREELFGIPAWKAHKSLMRDETWKAVKDSDAILFGAIGLYAAYGFFVTFNPREPEDK